MYVKHNELPSESKKSSSSSSCCSIDKVSCLRKEASKLLGLNSLRASLYSRPSKLISLISQKFWGPEVLCW